MADFVRWGLISTARIAREKVVPAARQAPSARFMAIASRDIEKARTLARDLEVPTAYGSYEELLDDPAIDAVYNPLPNSMHFEWTVKAAEAGKHILCEKPLADDAAQASQMVDACNRHGVLLMEAFMYRFSPRLQRARQIIESGKIGASKLVRACFSFATPRNPERWRMQPAYAGGALADVGCYCVNVARFMFGAEPVGVEAKLDIDPELGVDLSGAAMLEFSSNRRALIDFSFEMGRRQELEVVGAQGSIVLPWCFLPPPETMRIQINLGTGTEFEEFPADNTYALELEAFSKAVLEGRQPSLTTDDALANARVLDAVRESHATDRRIGVQPQQ